MTACLRPGDWASREAAIGVPLYDSPDKVFLETAPNVAWLSPDHPVLVLAVTHGHGGHERALVLFGQGRTAWCWGGYLTQQEEGDR